MAYDEAIAILLIGIPIVLALLLLSFKQTNDSEGLNLTHAIMRIFLFFMALYLCIPALSWGIRLGYIEGLGNETDMLPVLTSFASMNYFIWIVIAFVIVVFIFDVLLTLWNIIRRRKEKKQNL